MMEIKFTAHTWEEMQLVAEFIKRLSDMQQRRIASDREAKAAGYSAKDYFENINELTQTRPGAVLGGIAKWPTGEA